MLLEHNADRRYGASAVQTGPFLTAGGRAAALARARGFGLLAPMSRGERPLRLRAQLRALIPLFGR